MNKLNKLYKSILEALGCSIKSDYSIVMANNGNEYQIKVDRKQVYLPVSDALNVVDLNRAFFHPACESIASKETEMDKVLRKLITSSLYFSFRPIADVLFKAATKKSTKTLSSNLVELLAPLRNADKEVMEEVVDLVKRISMATEYDGVDTRIIALTISRGGKTDNDEHIYYRCVPSFPFYAELVRVINQNSELAMEPKTKIIFGDHKYSYQAAQCVALIFEIAIPSVLNPARAEAVSITQTGARMCAMLRTFGYIANEINTIIGKFRKEFDAIGVYGLEVGWVEDLDNLPDIAALVPPMEYNNYNTASKPSSPEQDQVYNPFSIQRVESQRSVSSQVTETPAEPKKDTVDVNRPPARNGETYIGMNALANGLIEYRFQVNNIIRVVCVNSDGKVITENFTNANNQNIGPFANNGYPLYNNAGNGWQQGNGYVIQPNGVVIPSLLPTNVGFDPYSQTGWGNGQNNTQTGWGAAVNNNNHILPAGPVTNNW